MVTLFERWHKQHGWRWSTMARNMGTAIGAFAHLPLYSDSATGMNLMFSPVWRKAVQAAERLSREERPRTPKAASPAQVEQAVARSSSPAVKALLIMAWQSTMRLGDVAQLRRADVKLAPMRDAQGLSMAITFYKSKTGHQRDPHTVHAFLPRMWTPHVVDYINNFAADSALFPASGPGGSLIAAATAALKVVDPTLEARSLRRGSLQTLATKGATHEQLMHFSGHKTLASLLRYLNWGSIVGKRESELQELGTLLAPTA